MTELTPKAGDWIDVRNYEGLYKINRVGEVRGYARTYLYNGKDRTHPERTVAQFTKPNQESKRVQLTKDGKQGNKGVIQLMLEAFFDSKDSMRYDVIYRDGDCTNYSLDNIRVLKKGI